MILRCAVLSDSDVPSPLSVRSVARSLLQWCCLGPSSSQVGRGRLAFAWSLISVYQKAGPNSVPSVEDEPTIYILRFVANLVNAKNFEVPSGSLLPLISVSLPRYLSLSQLLMAGWSTLHLRILAIMHNPGNTEDAGVNKL